MRTNTAQITRRTGARTGAVTTAILALAAAGCGATGSTASGAAATHHPMASHSHAMAEQARFGSDCGMVPATGMGSFHGMSMAPVVSAAMHNPLLTSFAADVKHAGLTSDLNSMHAFTVFAPANSAFAKLPAAEMSMMHSTAELAKILKYHIVNGRVTPAELAHGMAADPGGRLAAGVEDGLGLRGQPRPGDLRQHPDGQRDGLRDQQGPRADALKSRP